jgi:hypothetical protein
MPPPVFANPPEYVGMGTAAKIIGRGPAVVLRLALIGQVNHIVCEDGRPLFEVESLRQVRERLATAARIGA